MCLFGQQDCPRVCALRVSFPFLSVCEQNRPDAAPRFRHTSLALHADARWGMARTGPSETDKIMTMKFFMHHLTNGAFTFPPIAGHVRVQMVDLRVPPDKLVVKHLAAIDLEKNTMPGGRQVLSPLVSAEIGEASDEFLLDACSSLKEFGYLESWCTEFRASCKSNPTIKATPN